jgi:hypothetical protein
VSQTFEIGDQVTVDVVGPEHRLIRPEDITRVAQSTKEVRSAEVILKESEIPGEVIAERTRPSRPVQPGPRSAALSREVAIELAEGPPGAMLPISYARHQFPSVIIRHACGCTCVSH